MSGMAGRDEIVSMEIWKATFPFRMTFSHNLASRSEAETLIVILTDSNGVSGYGQVLPRAYLTGETIESAIADLQKRWRPKMRGPLDSLYREADSLRLTASYAGIDTAVFSLMAKSSAPSSFSNPFPLVAVIPALSPSKAAWLTRTLRLLGYRRFKVKVARDAQADTARVAAVRRAAGRDAWLIADANGAWNPDEAVSRMRALARLGVSIAEEPLAREAAAAVSFRALEESTGVAIMADESLCTLSDAESLIARGSPSWWNLRLAKNGGISGVSALAALARAHGIHIYGGILVGETGALSAAGRHIFPRIGAECGEYGFSLVFLRGDPFRGAPAGYFGRYGGEGDWGNLSLNKRILAERGELLYQG